MSVPEVRPAHALLACVTDPSQIGWNIQAIAFADLRGEGNTFRIMLVLERYFFFFFFYVALRPQRPSGLLGTGGHLWHLVFPTAPVLGMSTSSVQCCFTSTEAIRTLRDGEPSSSISTFTQLLRSEGRKWLFYLSNRTEKEQW